MNGFADSSLPRPRVSTIMPVHNGARYITEALDSLRPELRPGDEVIVVDDGSTDDSAQIAKCWAGPVRVEQQSCRGPSAARNRGLDFATGEWITFLDADDSVTPNKLAHLGRYVSENQADVVYGGQRRFVSPDCMPPGVEIPEIDEAVAVLPGTMLVRRAVFDRAGAFNPALKVGELLDWFDRVRSAGFRIQEAPGVVLRRRRHDKNISADPAYRMMTLQAVRQALLARRRSSP
jgi:glycosyltransferase involved in cell wall biosynthesis